MMMMKLMIIIIVLIIILIIFIMINLRILYPFPNAKDVYFHIFFHVSVFHGHLVLP
jgi:hypothetical protein